MPLPNNFYFSQSSLQDYLDCNRRFYFRYIKSIRWPAVHTEPIDENEKFILDGTSLHEAINQYFIGIPESSIKHTNISGRFDSWWQNFENFKNNSPLLSDPATKIFSEHTLIGSISQYRIIAKYDLIVFSPDNNVTIFDWKTSRKKPNRSWLLKRMQTKIYPALLLSSGQHLHHNTISPNTLSMVYWFAQTPNEPEIIKYSEQKMLDDHENISEIISLISKLSEDESELNFPKTNDTRRCAYCVYRSLCDQGIQAGKSNDFEDQIFEEIELDIDQISEVPF